jgi:glutamate 5-kinase
VQKRIVIKIGSNVITDSEDLIDKKRLSLLVAQTVALYEKGIDVLLVSSGAVAIGKLNKKKISKNIDIISERQIYASIGQIKLMETYCNLFSKYGITCGQILVTKEDFIDRKRYLNIRNCTENLLKNKIIPIVNENDVISINELMFTDNDELSGLFANMIGADDLYILTNVDGIYDGNPNDFDSKVIKFIIKDISDIIKSSSREKSEFGRGGIITKYNTAYKTSKLGVNVFIANGTKNNIITDLYNRNAVSTMFPASKKTLGVKKWLAYSDEIAEGELYIDKKAKEALQSNLATSLLLVGVNEIKNNFKKGALVKIIDENNKVIGVGISNYDSDEAKKLMGKKNIKPIVHYDYLHLTANK